MPPARIIVGFFARLVLFYVLLMVPWPGVGRGYAAFFRGAGEFLVGSFNSIRSVSFRSTDDAIMDTKVVAVRKVIEGTDKATRFESSTSSRLLGYMPTAELIALVLATPITWPRRLRSLFWGLLLVNVFVAMSAALPVVAGCLANDAAYGAGSAWTWAIRLCGSLLVHLGPGFAVVAPLLIWIVVSIRRGDWQRWCKPGHQ